MEHVLLATFVIYSLCILGIGVWGYRRESLAAFAVADRQMGIVMGTGAFVATFISAVTVIGMSGYASQYGWAAAAFTCYGYATGWILLVIAAVSWGGMASTLFVPLFCGLFWKRATRTGAIASSVGGLTFATLGFVLKRAGLLGFHEIYPGLVASIVLMVVVSLATHSNTESVIARFFPESLPAGARRTMGV